MLYRNIFFVKCYDWKVFFLLLLLMKMYSLLLIAGIHVFTFYFRTNLVVCISEMGQPQGCCYWTGTLEKWRGRKVHKCGFHNFNKPWTIPINSWGEWEYFIFYKQPPPPLNVKSYPQPPRLIQNHKSHTMISFLINLSTSF